MSLTVEDALITLSCWEAPATILKPLDLEIVEDSFESSLQAYVFPSSSTIHT